MRDVRPGDIILIGRSEEWCLVGDFVIPQCKATSGAPKRKYDEGEW
jgi:hypothetical protein